MSNNEEQRMENVPLLNLERDNWEPKLRRRSPGRTEDDIITIKSADNLCTERYLWGIAQTIHPDDYRSLAQEFDIDEVELEQIKYNARNDSLEIPYQILLKWKRMNGGDATQGEVDAIIAKMKNGKRKKPERMQETRSHKGYRSLIMIATIILLVALVLYLIFPSLFAFKESEISLETRTSLESEISLETRTSLEPETPLYENMTGRFAFLQREFDSTGFNESSALLKKLREDIISVQNRTYKDVTLPQPPWLENKELPLEDLYININMQDITRENTQRIFHITLEQMFIKIDEEPLRILVEGAPGIGKTTLCWKLLSDWGLGRKYIRSKFKMVFLFELRSFLETDSIETIFIHECEGCTYLPDEILKCIVKYQDSILLILDGFDEVSEKHKRNLLPLIQRKVLPSMFVVVTSRRGMFTMKPNPKSSAGAMHKSENDFDKLNFFNRRIILDGLEQTEIYKFIDKYFVDESHSLKRELDLFSERDMKDILQSPLFLLLLVSLLHEKTVPDLNSRTLIFKEFYNFLVRRNLVRENLIEATDQVDIFNKSANSNYKIDNCIQSLKCFGKYSLESLLKDEIIMEENDILKNCHDDVLLRLGFLTKTSRKVKYFKKVFYQPIHKSFLEFLSAFYAFQVFIDVGEETFIKEVRRIAKVFTLTDASLFYIFVSGLLNSEASVLFEALLPYSYWFNIENVYFTKLLNEIQSIDNFFSSYQNILPSFVPRFYIFPIKDVQSIDYSKNIHLSRIQYLILNYSLKFNLIKTLCLYSKYLYYFNETYAIDSLILYYIEDAFIFHKYSLKCRNLIIIMTGISQRNCFDILSDINLMETEEVSFRIGGNDLGPFIQFLPFNIYFKYSSLPIDYGEDCLFSLHKQLIIGNWKDRMITSLIITLKDHAYIHLLSDLVKKKKIVDWMLLKLRYVKVNKTQRELVKESTFEDLYDLIIESNTNNVFVYIQMRLLVIPEFEFQPYLDKIRNKTSGLFYVDGWGVYTNSNINIIDETVSLNNRYQFVEMQFYFHLTSQGVEHLFCALSAFKFLVEKKYPFLRKLKELSISAVYTNPFADLFNATQAIAQMNSLQLLFMGIDCNQEMLDESYAEELIYSLPSLKILAFRYIYSTECFFFAINSLVKGLRERESKASKTTQNKFRMDEFIVDFSSSEINWDVFKKSKS